MFIPVATQICAAGMNKYLGNEVREESFDNPPFCFLASFRRTERLLKTRFSLIFMSIIPVLRGYSGHKMTRIPIQQRK
jgi:hypothetical protein